jgi:hypothetical protein
MVFIGCGISGESGEEVGYSTDFGHARGLVFGRRILRRNVAERWSGLKELEELGRKFVGHGQRRCGSGLVISCLYNVIQKKVSWI